MSCPSSETLERFLTGGSAERTAVEAHVAGCVHCGSILDQLSDNPDLRRWAPRALALAGERANDEVLNRVLAELELAHGAPSRPESANTRETHWPMGRVLGPYRIDGEIGRGGMGVVLRAFDHALGRVVAVKVLRSEHADAKARARLVREAQAAAKLRHDNVVAVYAVVNPPDDAPYLVMEYLEGATLAALIRSKGRLDPADAAATLVQVAAGLETAHVAGLIHRDIKPSNILLDVLSGRAKITDFGLARGAEYGSGLTQESTLAGTPNYMSPEQARGERALDRRSDIYSLGVTLYEALTGELPFRGVPHMVFQQVLSEEPRSPRLLNDRIPRSLETICLKAMSKEPGHRYQTARDLGDDLTRWLRDEPIFARPATRVERAWRWCRRNPRVSLLSAALGTALLSGFLLVVWQWRRAEYQAHRAELSRQAAEANLKAANANFAHARRAVDQFYTRFYEQGVLGVPGLENVRHEVVGEMLHYYKDFLDQHRDDSALRREMAQTCQRLGGLTLEAGNKADGLGLLRRAARDFELLLAESPGERDLQDRLVVCLNNMGRVELDVAEYQNARKTYQRAIDLLDGLISEDPAVQQRQRMLAAVHGNLAVLLFRLDDKAGGRRSYLKALEMQRQLVRRDPAQFLYKNDLALTYHNLSAGRDRQRRDAASLLCRRRLRSVNSLSTRHPQMCFTGATWLEATRSRDCRN